MKSSKSYAELQQFCREMLSIEGDEPVAGYEVPIFLSDYLTLFDRNLWNWQDILVCISDIPGWTYASALKAECCADLLLRTYDALAMCRISGLTKEQAGLISVATGINNPQTYENAKNVVMIAVAKQPNNLPFTQLHGFLNRKRSEIEEFISPESRKILQGMVEVFQSCVEMITLISYNTQNKAPRLTQAFISLDDGMQAFVAEDFRRSFPEHDFSTRHFPTFWGIEKISDPKLAKIVMEEGVIRRIFEVGEHLKELRSYVERSEGVIQAHAELITLIDETIKKVVGNPRPNPVLGMDRYSGDDNSLLAQLERYAKLFKQVQLEV